MIYLLGRPLSSVWFNPHSETPEQSERHNYTEGALKISVITRALTSVQDKRQKSQKCWTLTS